MTIIEDQCPWPTHKLGLDGVRQLGTSSYFGKLLHTAIWDGYHWCCWCGFRTDTDPEARAHYHAVFIPGQGFVHAEDQRGR